MATGRISEYVNLQDKVRFNGGGHLNHEFFWDGLCSPKDSHLDENSELSKMLTQNFGSPENFMQMFNQRTATIKGSGWGWLAYNSTQHSLEYHQTHD